jgi:cell division protein FtsB
MKFGLSIIILLLLWIHAFSQKEIPYTLEDRERLIRLEEQMKALNQKIDGQNEKFEAKFDAIDDKFAAQNERFSMLFTLIYFVLGGIMGLIGFVLLDRRTFLKPVKDENKELAKRNDKLEQALRDYAKDQPKLAEVFRTYGIL